jgi:hypothetical protein
LNLGAPLDGSFTQMRSFRAKIAVSPTPTVFTRGEDRAAKPRLEVTATVSAAVATHAINVRNIVSSYGFFLC